MTNLQQTPSRAWHALAPDDVLTGLESTRDGLTGAEAARRLERYGPNELPREPAPGLGQIIMRQFMSPLIYILVLAAVVALVAAEFMDAAFIGLVLAVNALIGGWQEWKAEKSSRALQQLLRIQATVVRDGEAREVDAEQLVPGDLVWVESGGRVPADLRLVSAHGLEVDQSFLTGESLAVRKDARWSGADDAPLADRDSICFAGSIVVRGRGEGVVVATGGETAVGQLAADVMRAAGTQAPLMARMEHFSRAVAVAVLVAAVVVGSLGVLIHQYSVSEMLLFGVALAVAAIPEGLPITITVALAIATTRMARRGVIVRRLAAVEGLGSCTLVASDKTGTLTVNELTVRELRLASGEVLEVTGQGFVPDGQVLRAGQPLAAGADPQLARLTLIAVLVNEADLRRHDVQWRWRGDPTDIALLTLAHKLGWHREPALDRHPQVNEIPFEAEHRFAASYHRVDDRVEVFVKGAPERVLAMCRLDEASSEQLRQQAHAMAERGYRVLALASGRAPEGLDEQGVPGEPSDLEFAGFVGMIDPLRQGVREAVASCHRAGITVSMVTGDHPVTALAIARELGLADSADQVVVGSQLADAPPGQLHEWVRSARVFARVAPRQKLEIVEAARQAGHFVAVTGDGVNDAPALRAAHIGVAMGKMGTDVARESAELVISDDNFATIVSGIEEGRVAYDNIRKVIFLLVSTGAAEVLLLGLAVITGSPLPLLPVQILWLNLVTSGIQDKPLAFEPAEDDVLRRPPRSPQEPIFNRLMIERTLVVAAVMAAMGYGLFRWLLASGWEVAEARNLLLLFMVLMKTFHLGATRSETKYALLISPWRSPLLVACAVAAVLVHLGAMYFPWTQTILQLQPVTFGTFVALFAVGLVVFVAMELHKWTWALRYGPAASS